MTQDDLESCHQRVLLGGGAEGDGSDHAEEHVPLARQMLRTLLDGHIVCEPIEEDHRPGYRFTATGTFGRLLTGTSVINAGGGGEGS